MHPTMILRRAPRAAVFAALASLIAVAAPDAARASKAEDILGEWTLVIQTPRETRVAHLIVSVNANGDFEGHLQSAVGEADIDSFSVEGETHVMTYKLKMGEREVPMKLALKIQGDAIAGSVLMQQGEQERALDVSGAKAGTEAEKALLEELEKKKMEGAGEPILPIADAGDFVGEWTLTVESPTQGTQQADFVVKDVSGKASARLILPPPIGDQLINNIAKTEKGLALKYQFNFSGNPLSITLALALADGKLSGTMSDDGGLFEIPVAGVKKGTAPAPAPAAAGGSNEAAITGRAPRRQQRQGQTNVRGKVGGKYITIAHGRPSASAPGFNRIPFTSDDGTVWPMGMGQATKLKLETDYLFGEKRVPAGRYSLWAKKGAKGWSLLLNEKPDIWSTQHDPSADIAEVPLELGRIESAVDLLTIEINEENGEGALRLTWGSDSMTARFKPAP